MACDPAVVVLLHADTQRDDDRPLYATFGRRERTCRTLRVDGRFNGTARKAIARIISVVNPYSVLSRELI